MVARYVPARMGGFMMGAYFVSVGISQYLGGLVANLASVPKNLTDPLQTLTIYTALFNKLGIAAIVCTLIALAALPFMRKLTTTHQSHQ
jgi:POT family proton-dependent oligopeptide transporter